MLSIFQWICLFCILGISLVGGYFPLFRYRKADADTPKEEEGFPLGEAFAAGVFLALSLIYMLPGGFHLFKKGFPDLPFPLAPVVAIAAFLALLGLEHYTQHVKRLEDKPLDTDEQSPASIPVIMTIMIAIPSFFLGVSFAMSQSEAAVMIFIAIMAHKGSAGFALALQMVRSTLSKLQSITLYACFAVATPLGILIGADVHKHLATPSMVIVKAVVLSAAAGVFLYLSNLHELHETPLIAKCCHRRGYIVMVTGFIITALIKFFMAEVGHHGG